MRVDRLLPGLRHVLLSITLLGVHHSNAEWSARKKEVTQQAKQLMNNFWEWRLQEAPEFASKYGIHTYDAILEDYSEEAFVRRRENATAMLGLIAQIDEVHLGRKDRVSLNVMVDMLQTYRDGFEYRKMTAYVALKAGVGSIKSSWFRTLSNTIVGTVNGYHNLLSRYEAIGRQADQQINLTRQALALGFSWTKAILRTNQYTKKDAMTALIGPFNDLPAYIDNRTRDELIIRAKKAIMQQILPAIDRLNDFMEKEYRPKARPEVGLFALPGGLDLYEACLRWHLSINMTAQEVHALGLKEVDRIHNLMAKIRDRDGFKGDVRAFIAHLTNQTKNMYNSTDDMMSNIRDLLKKIKLQMPQVLLRVPTDPIRIEESPDAYGPVGSYRSSPLDKSRPAIYLVNTYKPTTSARFNMMPVVLHETEPGHHIQAAYKRLIDLPKFRQATDYSKYYATPFNWPIYSAYVEGWGLYSEYLGEELGLYEEPYGLLGRYSGEMLRACRLVVDTGIHAFGWSQKRAEDYIANHTALSQGMIHSEVNRYISYPGQSCAYKIGEIKIKELRQLSEKTLGGAFDMREFHHQVLSLSSVPLPILESSIKAWLRASTGVPPFAGNDNSASRSQHQLSRPISVLCFVVTLCAVFRS